MGEKGRFAWEHAIAVCYCVCHGTYQGIKVEYVEGNLQLPVERKLLQRIWESRRDDSKPMPPNFAFGDGGSVLHILDILVDVLGGPAVFAKVVRGVSKLAAWDPAALAGQLRASVAVLGVGPVALLRRVQDCCCLSSPHEHLGWDEEGNANHRTATPTRVTCR